MECCIRNVSYRVSARADTVRCMCVCERLDEHQYSLLSGVETDEQGQPAAFQQVLDALMSGRTGQFQITENARRAHYHNGLLVWTPITSAQYHFAPVTGEQAHHLSCCVHTTHDTRGIARIMIRGLYRRRSWGVECGEPGYCPPREKFDVFMWKWRELVWFGARFSAYNFFKYLTWTLTLTSLLATPHDDICSIGLSFHTASDMCPVVPDNIKECDGVLIVCLFVRMTARNVLHGLGWVFWTDPYFGTRP